MFDSSATDLVPNDSNDSTDVFVRDRSAGTTQLVGVDNSGNQGSSYSFAPAVSANGRYVAFTSGSPLVAADVNGAADVYVRDLVGHTTTQVSVVSGGGQLSGIDGSGEPDISADGRFVTFESAAPELVSPIGGASGYRGVFVRDMVAETTTRLDVSPTGAENNQGNPIYRTTSKGAISPNGRFVVFTSTGTNLVAGGVPDMCTQQIRNPAPPHRSSRSPARASTCTSEIAILNGTGTSYDGTNAVTTLANVAAAGHPPPTTVPA